MKTLLKSFACLSFLFIGLMLSSAVTYRVQGEIQIGKKGNLIIYIFNSDEFKRLKKGILPENNILIKKENISNDIVNFEFNDIPPGEYGIWVIQDINENGKMDHGFGPLEPSGFSWIITPKNRRFPAFNEILFKVDSNNINIKIKICG